MSRKLLMTILILICINLIYACKFKNKESKYAPVTKSFHIAEIDTTINKLFYPLNPLFQRNVNDTSFISFYFNALNKLEKSDTNFLLELFHDTILFSKYECADLNFLKLKSGGFACSKKGIFKGVFNLQNQSKIKLCQQVFYWMNDFGVGPINHFEYLIPENEKKQHFFSTICFKDSTLSKKFFNYEVLVLNKNKTKLYKSADTSDFLGYTSKMTFNLNDEIETFYLSGKNDQMFLKLNTYQIPHFINQKDILSPYSYILYIFGKRQDKWKIIGVIQPPGC